MIRRVFPRRTRLVQALNCAALVIPLLLGAAGKADGCQTDNTSGDCSDAEPGTEACQ